MIFLGLYIIGVLIFMIIHGYYGSDSMVAIALSIAWPIFVVAAIPYIIGAWLRNLSS